MRYWDHGRFDGHMNADWGIAMMLAMLGVWVVLIVVIGLAIVWAIRSASTPQAPPYAAPAPPGPDSSTGARSAEQILAERLARGDIDPEDYRARLDALVADRRP